MNAHGNQFIRIGMRVSQPLQFADELRRNAVDAKRDQLFEIHVIVTALASVLRIHSGVAPWMRIAINVSSSGG